MRKSLLLLLFFAVSILSFSQKCKYDLNLTDPFSGKTTRGINLRISGIWQTSLLQTEDSYHMNLVIVLPGDVLYVSHKGDTCMLLLENGEQIVMFSNQDVLPTTDIIGRGEGAGVGTIYYLQYPMTKEQMEKLSSSPLNALRVYLKDVPISLYEIPKRNAKRIVKAAACMLK